MRRLIASLLLVLACTPDPGDTGQDPTEPGPDTGETGETDSTTPDTGDTDSTCDTDLPDFDVDGDGYDAEAYGGDDCDDEDPEINPGATEIWYDGVDQDCNGGSDYDADGDGADAEAYGGTDCDDTDPDLQSDCPEPDSLLEHYTQATKVGTIPEIGANLSGITWNPDTGSFMAVLDSNRTLFELDTDMAVLREISISNIEKTDTEDIAYLGLDDEGHPTYAIVTEDGVVYLGPVPDDGATELDLADWQVLTYSADDMGNSGGEGVAYDPDTRTFWVCKEQNDMEVFSFPRPKGDEDASYEDGSLAVTTAFDAEKLLGDHAGDLASCMFDPRTGRLLILSERSDVVLDVDLSGAVLGELDLVKAGMMKPEGITLTDDSDLTVVGEPNQWVRYAYEAP